MDINTDKVRIICRSYSREFISNYFSCKIGIYEITHKLFSLYKNEGNVLTALSGNIFIFNILGVIAFGNIYNDLLLWIEFLNKSKLSIYSVNMKKKTGRKLSMYSSQYILCLVKKLHQASPTSFVLYFFSLFTKFIYLNDFLFYVLIPWYVKYSSSIFKNKWQIWLFFSYLAPRICLLWWRWWWRSPNSERAGAFLTWTTNSRW